MSIADRLHAQARIIPIRKDNQVESVTKNADGSLLVIQRGGNQFTIPANAPELQAFAVYTVLNSECNA